MTVTPLTKHPAPFSKQIIPVLDALVMAERKRTGKPEITVLDPLAGIGRIHQLARAGKVRTLGLEIEPEWAACHPDTICGDSFALMAAKPAGQARRYKTQADWDARDDRWPIMGFDVVCTSPPYGNRMADSHDAKDASTRRTYKHDLGRDLTVNNSGQLQWSVRYWAWMGEFYRHVSSVLAPGGLFLLNVSDFVKGGAIVPAVMFHRGACAGAGLIEDAPPRLITTDRMSYGANREARAPQEVVMRLRHQDPS